MSNKTWPCTIPACIGCTQTYHLPVKLNALCCVIIEGLFFMQDLTFDMFIIQTSVIPAAEGLDPDVLTTMNSLQCFKDREKLKDELLTSKSVL